MRNTYFNNNEELKIYIYNSQGWFLYNITKCSTGITEKEIHFWEKVIISGDFSFRISVELNSIDGFYVQVF